MLSQHQHLWLIPHHFPEFSLGERGKKHSRGLMGVEGVREGGPSVLGGRVTKTEAEPKNKVYH